DTKTNGLGGPKHRRGDVDREFNRFAGARLEDLQGDIPALCKDQHGCRYLQKKLEEDSSEHRDMIFRETFSHLSDLMTDPFGNYLCQKLLEFSTDEQRTLICEAVAQDLVQISLNMHGTRAVQKMIDFLSTQRQNDPRYEAQIRTIIVALSQHVVTLIKDLNGNHVVQKCLNRLAPEDNQFIYNAVAAHCVEVATHRHGCCVLQRCVDHALDAQRVQLVTEITYNALTLVQDPYGNYVVQYILDLNDNRFSDAVIRQFLGNVCALSVQKFSSNVIEKCIRVAEHTTRKMIIEELLNRNRLEKLLRDSFGNYCVQTALDYAEPGQRMILVEGIRPILPLIRNTPYGKRIQSKLQREHVETYGGYNHSNLSALSNGPRHHMPPSTTPHPRSVTDPYFRTSPYALAQNGAPSQLHPVPTMHNLQQHATDHAFSNHQVSGLGLSNQPL
ncbi:armadillo-type protein, partial [Cantharellus anzutake]|uniref:armadillo-type protein n=1 Tax=Cantharellus anzutake TaxID=1750568 RepID=UPI001905EC79